MAQSPSTKCNACNVGKGNVYCYDCEQVLCMKCKNVHDTFTPNKAHTVDTDLNRLFSSKPVCTDHQKEYLYYCKHCECLTCSECVISVHSGHVFCDFMEVVDCHRKQISDMASDLKAKVKVIENLMNTIKTNKLSQIKCHSNAFLKEVDVTATSIKHAVNSVKTYYETTASDYESMESEKLETILKGLKRLHKNYSDIYLKIENALTVKHGIIFLLEQKSIHNERENLDEIPDVPESNLMSNLNVSSFTDQVIEKIQEKFSIRKLPGQKEFEFKIKELTDRLTEAQSKTKILEVEKNTVDGYLTQKDEELKKLEERVEDRNKQFHEEKTKYEGEIKQLLDRLMDEQLRTKMLQDEKLSEQNQHEIEIVELIERLTGAQSNNYMLDVVPEKGFVYLHRCPACSYEKVFPSYDR